MKKSGVWPNIIQRPYGIVANPDDTPKSVFISTFDTSPLAPDFDFALRGEEKFFQAGVDILAKLTKGKVHLGLSGNGEISSCFPMSKMWKCINLSASILLAMWVCTSTMWIR
jgi:Na+-transporting NADH:ubiquinone oxidoreductase subunit A